MSKIKQPSDWQYVPRLRHNGHMPLRTTIDGVRGELRAVGVGDLDLPQIITKIDFGATYEFRSGIFRSIHRRLPSIGDRLHATAEYIRHTGQSRCWWLQSERVVWWLVAEEDAPFIRGGNPTVSSMDDILQAFHVHREVQRVRIEIEACPNVRRCPGWYEVYPRMCAA